MKVISLDNVNCSLENKSIIKNMSFDINKGDFVGILGTNGSGKSTLIKILAGIYDYKGYVFINGYTVDCYNIYNIRDNVAYILSDVDNYMIGELVIDELVMRLENLNKDRKYIEKRLSLIAKEFRLEKILHKRINEITNSERVIVSIASCLTINPSILIIDDCLGQLSYEDKLFVMKILKKYNTDFNMTILMVTNDTELCFYWNRVLVIEAGNICMDGPVKKVFRDRNKLISIGIKIPFVIDLSLNLMEKGIVNHIYIDKKRLVDDIWK